MATCSGREGLGGNASDQGLGGEDANGALSVPPSSGLEAAGDHWGVDLLRGERQKIIPCVHNIAVILRAHPECAGVLAFDEFAGVKTKRRDPPWGGRAGAWDDVDTGRVRAWLEHSLLVAASTEKLLQAIAMVSADNAFDSLQDELRAMRWDANFRVDRLLPTYFGTEDTPYTRLIGRRFMIGAVARAMRPGCKLDTMLIAEGLQGKRKSSGFRALFGEHRFSDDAFDLQSKDAMSAISKVWCHEFAELDALSRSEAATVKAFLSKQSDSFRPAYGREQVTRPRRVAFVGSTNDSSYLSDSTGGRRFWPFKASNRIDLEAILRDREVLWAEAVCLFESGERWWLDEEDAEAADVREEQELRQQDNPWVQPLAEWLEPRALRGEPVTTYDVLIGALGVDKGKITRAQTMEVAKILALLGWTKGSRMRAGGTRIRPYLPPGASPQLTLGVGTDDGTAGRDVTQTLFS